MTDTAIDNLAEQIEIERLEQDDADSTVRAADGGSVAQLHKMVWDFRREMQDYFPTPSQEDSLAFAFTEVAEAVDAELRKNFVYRRRSEKAHSIERELAQCAMMLLTAAGEEEISADFRGYNLSHRFGLRRIAGDVGYVYGESDREGQEEACCWIVSAIATMIDLPVHLVSELERMRLKHGPVRDTGPASLNEVANEHPIEYPQREERILLTEGRHDSATYTITATDAARVPLTLNEFEWLNEQPIYTLRDYRDGSGVE